MDKCRRCNIENNFVKADIMWVGLSDKPNTLPFANNTNSGKIINEIEALILAVKTYKTNLVKCAPLDENNKLRYPNKHEINNCFKYFDMELKNVKPKIVIILGNIVQKAVAYYKRLNFEKIKDSEYYVACHDDIYYLKVEHPSYLYIYKRKHLDDYINRISITINYLLKGKH